MNPRKHRSSTPRLESLEGRALQSVAHPLHPHVAPVHHAPPARHVAVPSHAAAAIATHVAQVRAHLQASTRPAYIIYNQPPSTPPLPSPLSRDLNNIAGNLNNPDLPSLMDNAGNGLSTLLNDLNGAF